MMSETNADTGSDTESPPTARCMPISIPIDLPARVHQDADGALWADVPALPGCVAGGESYDEVPVNIKEAAEGWLLAKQDIESKGWPWA